MSPVNGSFYTSPKANPSLCPGEYFPKRYSPGTGTKWFTNQIKLWTPREHALYGGGQIINPEICEKKWVRWAEASKLGKRGLWA